jgi:hypothetical protein
MTSASVSAVVDAKSEDLGLRARKAAHQLLARRATARGTVARKVEHAAKRSGTWLWIQVRRHSVISVTAAGAIGIGVATAVGVGELAVGVALAYAGYNVWVRGESPERAITELAEGLEGHGGGHH